MLNPSRATAVTDDRTVSKRVRYARDWGLGGLTVLNLFAWMSPRPEDLRVERHDPEGPQNRDMLKRKINQRGAAARIICARGNHAEQTGAPESSIEAAGRHGWPLEALQLTQSGCRPQGELTLVSTHDCL